MSLCRSGSPEVASYSGGVGAKEASGNGLTLARPPVYVWLAEIPASEIAIE